MFAPRPTIAARRRALLGLRFVVATVETGRSHIGGLPCASRQLGSKTSHNDP
jgi:hypothetical protein